MTGQIIYQQGEYTIRKAAKGYEVYREGVTAATRIAVIAYEGDKGFERAKLEVNRRELERARR